MTEKPKLAVDIDEVLYPFVEKFAEHHNDVYSTALTKHDFHDYIINVISDDQEVVLSRIQAFQETGALKFGDPIQGSIPALSLLSEHYDIFIVSARGPELLGHTIEWLMQHYPKIFSGVYFAEYWLESEESERWTKSMLCKKIGAGVLIEDSLKYAKECSDEGIRVLLFGNYPWNQAQELPAGVSRAVDWQAAVEVLIPVRQSL
jgi:uncharacterized HAD superfamily protein